MVSVIKDHKMIKVNSKKCQYSDCEKQPNYNNRGEKIGIFCAGHKEPQMIDVKHKRCQYNDCEKQPTYNNRGEKIPIF